MTEITYQYDVSLMVVRGQLSRTEVYRTAKRYKAQSDKECFQYYCGDLDPSGLSIYDSIKKRIGSFVLNINFERIALTEEQIEKYQLPSDLGKKSDSNYSKFVSIYGSDMVVELDSLPPDVLRKIIEDCILQNIDQGHLAQIKREERDEEIRLNKFIEKGI